MMRNFNLLQILPLIFLLGTSCQPSQPNIPSTVFNKPAYQSISDSIQQFPNNAALYIRRALLLSAEQLHAAAEADFKKAWQLQPQPNYGLAYISNLLDQQKSEEALPLLLSMRKKFPEENIIGRQLAQVYNSIGKKKEALLIYNQMIRADSLNAILWMEKGALLLFQKDTTAGIACIEKAYQLQPESGIGLQLATAYQNSMNPKVISLCDELLRNNQNSLAMSDVAMLKGQYYSDKGDFKKALQQFDQCITNDWKFVDAHLEKGIVYFRMKNYRKALEIFNIASTVSGSNADAHFWMGRCKEALGEKEDAIQEYHQSLVFDTSLTEAREHIKKLEHPES